MTSINVPADIFLDEKKPTERPKGKILRDRNLQDVLISSQSSWNHPRIYTELPQSMMPVGIIHGVSRQLAAILKDSEDQNIKKTMNHLIALRSLVNLYFDILKAKPPYIKGGPTVITGIIDMHKQLQDYIQYVTYFLSDPTSYAAQQSITIISLFLKELIHFYKLNKGEVYHLPGQVQPVANQYQKGYYILDSYYKYEEEEGIVKDIGASMWK